MPASSAGVVTAATASLAARTSVTLAPVEAVRTEVEIVVQASLDAAPAPEPVEVLLAVAEQPARRAAAARLTVTALIRRRVGVGEIMTGPFMGCVVSFACVLGWMRVE